MPQTASDQRWHWTLSTGFSVLGLGLMLYCLQASDAWIPALDSTSNSTYIVYEESAGTSWQVKIAFLMALLLITPVCFVFSRLPFYQRQPRSAVPPSASLKLPAWLLPVLYLLALGYFIWHSPDALQREPFQPALQRSTLSLWYLVLLVFLHSYSCALLSKAFKPQNAAVSVSLPASSCFAFSCLTLGLLTLNWCLLFQLAPVVQTENLRVLQLEQVEKNYKSGISEWVYAWLAEDTPAGDVRQVQLLQPELMQRLTTGQRISVEWAKHFGERFIKRVQIIAEPETEDLSLDTQAWQSLRGDWHFEPEGIALNSMPTESLAVLAAENPLPENFILKLDWPKLQDGGLLFDLSPDGDRALALIVRPQQQDMYWTRLQAGQWSSERLCYQRFQQRRYSDTKRMRGPHWQIAVAAWQGQLLASVNGQSLGFCEAARLPEAENRWALYLYGIPDNSPARIRAIQLHSL